MIARRAREGVHVTRLYAMQWKLAGRTRPRRAGASWSRSHTCIVRSWVPWLEAAAGVTLHACPLLSATASSPQGNVQVLRQTFAPNPSASGADMNASKAHICRHGSVDRCATRMLDMFHIAHGVAAQWHNANCNIVACCKVPCRRLARWHAGASSRPQASRQPALQNICSVSVMVSSGSVLLSQGSQVSNTQQQQQQQQVHVVSVNDK